MAAGEGAAGDNRRSINMSQKYEEKDNTNCLLIFVMINIVYLDWKI